MLYVGLEQHASFLYIPPPPHKMKGIEFCLFNASQDIGIQLCRLPDMKEVRWYHGAAVIGDASCLKINPVNLKSSCLHLL